MPTPTPEQFLKGYDSAVSAIRRAVLVYAETAWRSSETYHKDDIDRLVAMIVPRVQAGQVQVANLTSAYIAAITGSTSVPVDTAAIMGARGVPAADVYQRAGSTVYAALSVGLTLADAVTRGQDRLMSIAATDLQMAKTRQSQASISNDARVVGYRRVVHGDTCALCMIASTQHYRREQLLPIHPGCNCSVDPITGAHDPGQVIDEATLQRVHEAVQEATGVADSGGRRIDYRKLVVTREHGEIGPVLTWKQHKFTGPTGL